MRNRAPGQCSPFSPQCCEENNGYGNFVFSSSAHSTYSYTIQLVSTKDIHSCYEIHDGLNLSLSLMFRVSGPGTWEAAGHSCGPELTNSLKFPREQGPHCPRGMKTACFWIVQLHRFWSALWELFMPLRNSSILVRNKKPTRDGWIEW